MKLTQVFLTVFLGYLLVCVAIAYAGTPGTNTGFMDDARAQAFTTQNPGS